MNKSILSGLKYLTVMTILTGFLYPGLITIIASLSFNRKAQGSLVRENGLLIGSELIAQNFESPEYFWPRPSVNNYNPLPSGASNLGPLSLVLNDQVLEREKRFRQGNGVGKDQKVPPEMLTASASGLDPHISPDAAFLQVERVALARGLTKAEKETLINIISDLVEKPQFSILGQPRINVFLLNLRLDKIK